MSDGFHVTIEICGMNRRNVRERVTVWFARKKEKRPPREAAGGMKSRSKQYEKSVYNDRKKCKQDETLVKVRKCIKSIQIL